MNKEHEELLASVYQLIKDIENEDENIEKLEEAMKYWCSNWDICEGFKHAIVLCLEDQYNNHSNEQEMADLLNLKVILEK